MCISWMYDRSFSRYPSLDHDDDSVHSTYLDRGWISCPISPFLKGFPYVDWIHNEVIDETTSTRPEPLVHHGTQNRNPFAWWGGLAGVTVREDREVRAPPAKTLAALATAGENLGFTVRDVRAGPGLLLMTTKPSLKGASLGFIITARAQRFNRGTRLGVDTTPVLGAWARKSADGVLDDLIQEFQAVMGAPKARIRRPKRAAQGDLPFGRAPLVLGLFWAASALVLYGLVGGGWWWIPAVLGGIGGVMLVKPQPEPWWSQTVTLLGVLSFPFGLLGLIARKQARTNELWRQTIEPFDQQG